MQERKMLQTCAVPWLLAALLGDELVGIIMYGWNSEALGFSLAKPWWWIYQALLLFLFGPLIAIGLWRRIEFEAGRFRIDRVSACLAPRSCPSFVRV